MPIAPTPALAARAKKLSREKPTLWSVRPSTGRPTMPGSTAPSIQPTLKLSTKGSNLKILVPSRDAVSEEFGREYAVEAIRWDGSVVSLEVWKSTLIVVCRCKWDNCNVPCSATVKGVHVVSKPSFFDPGSKAGLFS